MIGLPNNSILEDLFQLTYSNHFNFEKDDTISKMLECSLCFHQLLEPKMLPCQHTFCLKCIIVAEEQIQCPLCLRKHLLTDNGAKGLPNNITIIALIEMNMTSNEVSSHVNKYCQKKLANVGNGANNPIANKKVGKPSYEDNPVGALLELFQWKGQMPRNAILPK